MLFSLRGSLFILYLSVTYALPVHADKVYTWKDENGNTHFGDKPAGRGAAEIQIKPTSVGDSGAQQRAERTKKYLDALSEDRKERTDAREKAQLEQQQRAEKCAAAKKSHQELREAQFVYTKSDSGEKNILSFEQRAAAEQKAMNKINEFCGKN